MSSYENTPTFTNKFPENDLRNALIHLLTKGEVSLTTVKSISDTMSVTEDQIKVFKKVTLQYYLLKYPSSSSKAVTSNDKSASSQTTTSNQPPVAEQKTKIQSPVNTRAMSSNDPTAQIHAQGAREKVREPLVTKYEQTRAAARVAGGDSALVSQPDSFKPDDVWLDLKGDDLTTSLRRDIYLGRAGGSNNDLKPVDSSQSARPRQALNSAAKNNATPVLQGNFPKTSAFTSTFALTSHASKTKSTGSSSVSGAAGRSAQLRPLLPETHGSRQVMAAVIPSTSKSNATREQSHQAAAVGSSTSRLSPPAERKQGIPLFPQGSCFRPISTQTKAPESSGAWPKYPQPVLGGGLVCPKPVSPDRKEAVPARSTGTLRQALTQAILGSSVHVGNATEEQISKIVRNLQLLGLATDEATCSGIKESINSLDLDKATIEQAAGDRWEKETKDALDRVQVQYTIQKSSPRSTPSVGAGLASDTDRPAGFARPIASVPVVVPKKRMGFAPAHNLAEVNTPAFRQAPSPSAKGIIVGTPLASQPVKSVKQREKTDRTLSDDAQQLRGLLWGLGIDPAKHEQITAIKPNLMEAGELDHTLKYEIGLGDDDARLILEHLKPSDEIDSLVADRQKSDMKDQAKRAKQTALEKKARDKKEEIKRFDYDNNLPLAIEFSLRDIVKPEYDVLAVGSQIDDRTGRAFDKRRTVFADAQGHSDLNGDIHITVDDIPSGKKFKEIHFTGLPGCEFNSAEKNRLLFQKLNCLMEDGGKLFVKFGANSQDYNNQLFIDSILRPEGFGQFMILRPDDPARPGVRLSACKVKAMRTPSTKGAESSLINTPSTVIPASADLRPAKAAESQTPVAVSGNQPLQEIWSRKKDQLTCIMQSYNTSFDHELIEEALQNPLNPEFNLTSDEFANLKVRYEEWRENEQYTGLPFAHKIKDFSLRVQKEKQLFEAIFEDPSASIHMPTAAGASARAFSPVTPPRTESVNFPERPFRANAGQIELSDGGAFNAFALSGLPDRKPAQPGRVSRNLEMVGGNTRPSPRGRIPAIYEQNDLLTEMQQVPPVKSTPLFNNGASDQQVEQVVKHLRTLGIETETLAKIKDVFRQLRIPISLIQNAACGDNSYLTEILTAYAEFQSSPPQSPPVETRQVRGSAEVFSHLDSAVEDVTDGFGIANPSQFHQSAQRFNPRSDVEADGANDYESVFAPGQLRPQVSYTGSQQLQQREQTVNAAGQWLGMDVVSDSLRLDLARASEQAQIELSELVSPNNQNSTLLGSNVVTPAQANLILAGLKKEDPNLSDSNIEMIRRHVGYIQLNQGQVDKAIHGGRDSLGDILLKCQIRETQVIAEEPDFALLASGTSQPGVLLDIRGAGKQPAQGITHSHNNVVSRVHAGIQARNNNCGLASFFMSISHNGLLGKLIVDAENKIERLYASREVGQARSLTELVDLLKKFNVGGDLGKYIPNDELDNIRLRYGLRAAKLNRDAAVDALTKNGQVVNFEVESEFNRGADLNASTRKASMSLQILAVPAQGSSCAVVVSLPDPSLGYMRLRGINLAIGQQLTQTDLVGLEFVPLGEILEPIEFIPPILDEIYGYLNTEAGLLQSLSQLQSSTMSLKQKVSMVEVQNDRKTLRVDSKPSVNFDHTIDDEVIPGDLMLNENETVKQPHAYLRHLTGKVTEHYYKDGILRLKLTKELHHRDQSETRKVFDFFDQYGNPSGKTVVEMEKHFRNGIPFVRARESEFVSPQSGKTMRVEQRMAGYSKDYPTTGTIKTCIMQRAVDFEDLIDIFINSWKDQYGDIERARRALLPDQDNSPEVIFMTIPNEGKDNRCNFDWQKDVGVPLYGIDQRVPYEVSAVMAIEGSHYLSWLRDRENGLMHFADSMGDIDDHNVTIPVVVTMPDQDAEAALQAADDSIKGANNYYKDAKDRLKVLGSQVALVILKKK